MTAVLAQRDPGLGELSLPIDREKVDNRPIVVATDATDESDAALRTAQSLALHTLRSVHVVAVYEPLPITVPEVAIVESPEMLAQRQEDLRRRVQQQFDRVGLIYNWPVELVCGDPASSIARIARRCEAAIVIMGLGRHGLVQRLMGDETVLRMLRLNSVPVLAVAPGTSSLPIKIFVGMDFSPSSLRALSLVRTIAHPFAQVTVAHVAAPLRIAALQHASTPSRFDVDTAFERMEREVALPRSMTLTRRIYRGDPAKVLLRCAAASKPDLIVVGSHGHGFLSRLLIGSVSQKLVRESGCSILVAPPEDGATYFEEMPATVSRVAEYQWVEQLEEFTRRNVARPATLEVMDPEFGAQLEERGLPFRGAAYDSRDRRVQIMLGDGGANGRHLTRTIAGASAVQVLRDNTGRDVLLRVAHGRGQTLLTLAR